MMRGLVIVLMAIDHARDMFMIQGVQDPMTGADIEPGLYITRWITHFCAPVFVLLAGTSAGLMSARKSQGELAGFLVKRGLWLIFVEIFVIANVVTFEPFGSTAAGGAIFVFLQVIWVIGASMIILAGLQYFGRNACLWIGIAILVGQHLLEGVWPASGANGWGGDPLWYGLYTQATTVIKPFAFIGLYPLIPWIGMMALGFGITGIFEKEPVERDRVLMQVGLTMIVIFAALRALDVYGDPNPWQSHESLADTSLTL